ncbi:hypothetical protein AB0F16_19005 [Streptomyces tanashiensis]|uniref:hypothetical protein n=1 Tax=Streptomyces tanashiensis TaxID=67367 RepID=UPI0033F061E1
MRRRFTARHSWRSTARSGTEAHSHQWAGDLRYAGCWAVGFLTLLLVVDAAYGTLSTLRSGFWAALALTLFLILLPPRVTAGPGWLATRGLFRTRRVRTDRLISVVWSDGVAQRLVLKDSEGGLVPLDPRVLVDHPCLWHLLDAGARVSRERGTLECGTVALRRLSSKVDGETARAVFRASGMDA